WKHPGVDKVAYDEACRRRSSRCLWENHRIKTVEDTLTISSRRTVVARKPHTLNPSGVSRQNCGCRLCQRDRNELRCKNPGVCIETAKMLINSISTKLNPLIESGETLSLTEEEQDLNNSTIESDECKIFEPDMVLNKVENGFRIF
ncbi:hypothetical protein R3P38DRAFT_2479017, partial [Favolaschia claudopus]